MLTAERRQAILDFIQTHRAAKVTQLSGSLGVSVATVRRDLQDLEAQGRLRRVHGGAMLAAEGEEPPAAQRAVQHAAEKRRIGEAAARLVADGSTVLITSGTTTEAMLPYLADKTGLTVITNALNIAFLLSRYPHITVVVLGGWLRHSELSLLGHLTLTALADLRADKIFQGTFALDPERGLEGIYLQEVETDRALITAARELVVLADSSKFSRVGAVRIVPMAAVSTLVTDTAAPTQAVQTLRERGITVIQA